MNKSTRNRRYVIATVGLVIVVLLYLLNWSWLLVPVVVLAILLAFWS
jgi:hypothetical protein